MTIKTEDSMENENVRPLNPEPGYGYPSAAEIKRMANQAGPLTIGKLLASLMVIIVYAIACCIGVAVAALVARCGAYIFSMVWNALENLLPL